MIRATGRGGVVMEYEPQGVDLRHHSVRSGERHGPGGIALGHATGETVVYTLAFRVSPLIVSGVAPGPKFAISEARVCRTHERAAGRMRAEPSATGGGLSCAICRDRESTPLDSHPVATTW